MGRVLIAGCGYVGAAAADLLHGRGWEVEGWTASAASAATLSKPYRVRAVDLTDRGAVARAATQFECVIQCASSRGGTAADYRRIYFDAAQNLIAVFPDARRIFTSSTSVYGQKAGEWVNEESAATPAHETGLVLRETEELVLASDGVVARIAGIYGPGRSALLRKFLSGKATIDPTERFVNQAHRDDIAAALVLLLEAGVGGEIYNVSDGHPIPQRACYEWLAARLQRPLPPVASSAPRKRGTSNKRVSNEKLRALGWQPEYPTFELAMERSILPNLSARGA